MKAILQQGEGDKVLRKEAQEIPIEEITSPKIKKIIKEMTEALRSQDDGVALAAPQVGYSLSLFVVSGRIFDESFLENRDGKETEISPLPVPEAKKEVPKDLVFINPKISKLSRDKEWLPEGCLSVRWLYGEVRRSKKATVTAYDENGKKFTRGASGLLAQIFQHETDHLKGVLFIDLAKDVRDEPPQV
ncbi:MAG TPA: peptide deformylase [Candidatus Paceibacterota bacterium]|nr:peptide deformylase [Candidatus Paceibacterota bacterium]